MFVPKIQITPKMLFCASALITVNAESRAPIESSRIELLPGLELDSKIRIESRINIRPFPNHATGN